MNRPKLQTIGQLNHPDFAEASALLREQAEFVCDSPELIVIAQHRPGAVRAKDVEFARRQSPLAGSVALLGSYCEGEMRTGRPWPGIGRIYWYEFPSWWRRQMVLRDAGRCPDWARPGEGGKRSAEGGEPVGEPSRSARQGVVVIQTARRDTAGALGDLLAKAGYSSIWQPFGTRSSLVRHSAAGIWVGGQLNDQDAVDLSAFCQRLARDAAPVIAFMDFPRRDHFALALELGAATVLGMPWSNRPLIATIDDLLQQKDHSKRAA